MPRTPHAAQRERAAALCEAWTVPELSTERLEHRICKIPVSAAKSLGLDFDSSILSACGVCEGCHCSDVSPHAGRLKFVGVVSQLPRLKRVKRGALRGGPAALGVSAQRAEATRRSISPHIAAAPSAWTCCSIGAPIRRESPAAPRVASWGCSGGRKFQGPGGVWKARFFHSIPCTESRALGKLRIAVLLQIALDGFCRRVLRSLLSQDLNCN